MRGTKICAPECLQWLQISHDRNVCHYQISDTTPLPGGGAHHGTAPGLDHLSHPDAIVAIKTNKETMPGHCGQSRP